MELSRATPDERAERRWQRTALARLVRGWSSWDEDRAAWRTRVEGEWIPRIEKDLTREKVNIPEYTETVKRELVPWARRK